MRLAYRRYSGSQGFTPEEFLAIVGEIGGVSVASWLERAVASTTELDYAAALDWFGLQFAIAEREQQPTWQLQINAAASREQLACLCAWVFDVGQ
jgi:predicted metalloprotease with PDZ domain